MWIPQDQWAEQWISCTWLTVHHTPSQGCPLPHRLHLVNHLSIQANLHIHRWMIANSVYLKLPLCCFSTQPGLPLYCKSSRITMQNLWLVDDVSSLLHVRQSRCESRYLLGEQLQKNPVATPSCVCSCACLLHLILQGLIFPYLHHHAQQENQLHDIVCFQPPVMECCLFPIDTLTFPATTLRDPNACKPASHEQLAISNSAD